MAFSLFVDQQWISLANILIILNYSVWVKAFLVLSIIITRHVQTLIISAVHTCGMWQIAKVSGAFLTLSSYAWNFYERQKSEKQQIVTAISW